MDHDIICTIRVLLIIHRGWTIKSNREYRSIRRLTDFHSIKLIEISMGLLTMNAFVGLLELLNL